ncbi:hypothetical protein JTB14_010725 [Gonioctena quinquepunctata]|nr:hypothetical protein JTB14_010725 [Gonioctena quinquepunctata]
MPKGRQNAKEKIGNKRKLTIECATQTQPLWGSWFPSIILERLDNFGEPKRPGTESILPDGNRELSVQNSPISIQPRPSHISKAPTSYRYFVKPITNNEKANSTLDNSTRACVGNKKQNINIIRRRKSVSNWRRTNIKPGPLSYKLRVLQDFGEDMNVPVMLSKPSTSRVERRPSLNLDTISEKSEDNLPITDLEFNVNVESERESNQVISGSQEVGSLNDAFCRNQENFNKPPGEIEVETVDVPEPEQPERVHLGFNGITTVISQDSGRDNSDTNTSCGFDKEADEVDWNTHKKYVKIKAHTVHIHNHFYKP